MIDKLSYDEVLNISQELKKASEVVRKLSKDRDITEMIDFASTVEGYSRYLENTVGINKDADETLKELKDSIK